MDKTKASTIKTKKVRWTYKNCGPITIHNTKIWDKESHDFGVETRRFLGIPMLISRNKRMFDFGNHETRTEYFKLLRYQVIFGNPDKLKEKLLVDGHMAFVYYEVLQLGRNKTKKWPGQETAAIEICDAIKKWQKENPDKIKKERKNQQKNKDKK